MKAIWNETFTPRHSEVDRNGRLKLKSLFDYFQEAAANHASELGCGMDYLRECGKMWVLSRLKVEVLRTPTLGEPLMVKTYPSGRNRLFSTREFDLRDAGGTTIVRGTSFWLLLATESLRPLRPADHLPDMVDNSTEPRFFPDLDKLPDAPGLAGIYTATVRDSQIDLNDHLNNAEYAAMVHNAAAEMFGGAPEFSAVQINYLSAANCGEEIAVRGLRTGRNFFIDGVDKNGVVKFQAEGAVKTDL